MVVLSCILLSSCTEKTAADGESSGAVTGTTVYEGKPAADEEAAGEKASETASAAVSDDQKKTAASADLSDKARRISDQYNVQILYGSDVPLVFNDYTAAPLEDPEKTAAALRELDRTLSLYPPGFFTSVKEGYCDSIKICLAKDLHAINDSTYIDSAHAFTTVQDGTVWLVLSADTALRRGTLIHELTHVIDYRLLGMHQLKESEWNRLNPPSFSYSNAYLDKNGIDLRISGSTVYTALAEKDPENIWFWDPYSKTFAMEDRARLMEKLLDPAGPSPEEEEAVKRCFSSPNIQTKLRFYFYTLRQAFKNARWPEETTWEAELQKYLS